MTRPEFIAILQPLVSVFRADMDIPTWTAYFRALEDVPVPLLQSAVDRAVKSSGQFFPKAGELRQFAEDARKALMAAQEFQPCEMCSAQGWTEVTDGGVRRMTRCQCWKFHQDRIAQLGVGHEPLTLPAGNVHEPDL